MKKRYYRALLRVFKPSFVGGKTDYGRVGGSLALFEIKMPVAQLDSQIRYYAINGEQRNRVVELNVFGEPVLGLRLNASATWLDATLSKNQNDVNNGKTAIGVPDYYGVLGAITSPTRITGQVLMILGLICSWASHAR